LAIIPFSARPTKAFSLTPMIMITSLKEIGGWTRVGKGCPGRFFDLWDGHPNDRRFDLSSQRRIDLTLIFDRSRRRFDV
jgi:hypothetical protein